MTPIGIEPETYAIATSTSAPGIADQSIAPAI
jgi:hypothetical protein